MFLSKIIKNNAMRSDPPEIYNLRVLLVTLAACSGGLLFGMDLGTIGGVLNMTSFQADFGLLNKPPIELANLSSNIVSVIQAGAFAGALASTWLAGRVGRRWSLLITSWVVTVGVILQAAATGNIGSLYAGRFITGLGVGVASSVNPLYVSENAPRAIRGLLTGLYQFNIVTGLTIAFWINYGCLLNFTGRTQYLVPLSLQVLPAIIMFFGMLLANESPRYLAQKNQAKAIATLAKLRGLPEDHEYVVAEMNHLIMTLEEEATLMKGTSVWSFIREAVRIRSYRRRTVLCIALMGLSNLTGTNAMTYYSPTIFSSLGIRGAANGLFATGIYGIVKMVSCFIFLMFVSDSFGRRNSFLVTGTIQGLALFYVGFYVRFDPPSATSAVNAPGYVALVAIYIFAAVYQFGWGPIVWTYCSEIPPARDRPFMMGIATASQWLFNFVVAKATPSMFATLGANGFGTYFVYGSFCFCAVTFAWFFVPETKGLALEDMDELFDRKAVRGHFVPTRHREAEAKLEDEAREQNKKATVDYVERV